jgi:tetratricopeptide (TPR) repeat protein
LAIDDTQAEAHALLGGDYDATWEWAAAAREFERTVELNPNNARAHVLYALHLEYLGKMDEVIVHIRRAIELDPLNLNGLDNLAEAYVYTRQYAESIEQSKKVLEIDPTFGIAHYWLARGYELTGKYDLWLEEWEKETRFLNDPDLALVEAARREYPKSGYRGALKRISAFEGQQGKGKYIDPAETASYYAILGEKDKAFAWLEKAYAEKSSYIRYLKVEPYFDSLRSDPRYADLRKRMGLPQ